MDEIKPINSKGDPYKVQVDEKELASRIDSLSFDVLRKAHFHLMYYEKPQLRQLSLVSTQILKQSVYISAKPAVLNYLDQILSSTPDVAGHLFMHPQQMMPLS